MAGSATVTERTYGSVKLITCAWTSDASGDSDAGVTTELYDGEVVACALEGGATAPTAEWDCEVTDDTGADVLGGSGVGTIGLAAGFGYVPQTLFGGVAQSKLTFVVSNGGNAKTGLVHLWVR